MRQLNLAMACALVATCAACALESEGNFAGVNRAGASHGGHGGGVGAAGAACRGGSPVGASGGGAAAGDGGSAANLTSLVSAGDASVRYAEAGGREDGVAGGHDPIGGHGGVGAGAAAGAAGDGGGSGIRDQGGNGGAAGAKVRPDIGSVAGMAGRVVVIGGSSGDGGDGGDGGAVAVPDGFCQSCSDDDDCVVAVGAGSRCVPVGGSLACGLDCSNDGCPDPSMECRLFGPDNTQCVPVTGDCDCTAATHAATRDCVETNEFGTCVGIQTCDAFVGFSPCTARIPAGELCDRIDNDCDASIDEPFWAGGSVPFTDRDGSPGLYLGDSCGVGACRGGTVVCDAAGLALTCSTLGAAADEVCNGIDDDCNGLVDEPFAAGGTRLYDGGPYAADANQPAGAPCGVGACAGGTVVCTVDQLALTCSTLGSQVAEVCNGADDDCDGQIDEDFAVLGLPCDGDDADACAYGTYTCGADGADVECVNETVQDIAELCNGQDDDCDGAFDEDFPQWNQACDGPDSDDCEYGTYTCNAAGTGLECVNESVRDMIEACNGADDDCDGEVDEDFALLGQPCDGADADACETGTYTCDALGIAVECVNEPGPVALELCNGFDDDCDGEVDEDFALLGTPCDGADSDWCQNGSYTCSPTGAAVECVNESELSIAEACNGLDDDCDGEVDEDFALLGMPCDGADHDWCENGTYTCSPDQANLECVNEAVDYPDLCDGSDDDCNPTTADGSGDPRVGQRCDGLDTDECLEGVVACVGGALLCGDNSSSSVEECNGLDDDCDGELDEDFIRDDDPICETAWRNLGSLPGDIASTPLADSGWSEAWVQVTLTESNPVDSPLSATVTLESPPGVDFDLYVYCSSCGGTLAGASALASASGHTEVVHVRNDDDAGFGDEFSVIVEVRHHASKLCAEWILTIEGNTPAGAETCPISP